MHSKISVATALIASSLTAIAIVPSAMTAFAAHREIAKKLSTDRLETTSVADANGNLHVPEQYRATYQFLGSWAVAPDRGQSPQQLHDVYASPGTVTAYQKTGRFPDGAVLVKEVFQADTGKMTTGSVSHAGALKGWFVMMKDDKGRHPDNKLWGDGWAWSWFDAGKPSKTTSTDYKTDCQSCHVPAKASDWIYVSGYPVLGKVAASQ